MNSLTEQQVDRVEEDFKLFNFYEGYCRVYTKNKKKNILGSILFLSVLSFILSTEFSYRQTVAAN